MRCSSFLIILVCLSAANPASAQPYARFDVADSLLGSKIAKAGAQFESAWNGLLVAELRASAAHADSARRLQALSRRVAAAEEAARGTRIGADALALRQRWTTAQRGVRVRAAVRESIGVAAQAARRWDEADRSLRLALADYRSISELRREAWVLGTLGLVAFTRGDIAHADSLYRIALVARQRIGDAPMIGNTLNSLGATHYLNRDYAQARGFLEGARAVREKTGELGPLGATLNSLGLTLIALGQPDSARECFEHALELTVAAGDSLRTAEVLTNTMGPLADRGKLARALELGQRAAAIQQEQGNPASEARLRLRLGDLRRRQGRFAEAVEELDAATSLARDAVDVRALLDALGDRGRLALVIGDYEGARPLLLGAVRLADSLDDASHQASALNNLAQVADFEGDPAEAERFAMQGLDKARAAEDRAMVRAVSSTLGNIAMSRRDAAAMARWYGEAAADTDVGPDLRASDLNALAIAALESEDLDRASALFEQSARVARDAQLPDLAWPPLLGLGEVAERRRDFRTALARTRQAVTMIDSLRATQAEEEVSITVLADRSFATEALIHLLTKLQPRFPDSAYDAEAFTWAERIRARALARRMHSGSAGAGEGALADLARLRAELPKGAAFLEYSLGDSSSSLWLVTRRGARHFPLPPRRGLRGRVEILRRSLADPATAESPGTWRAARGLYELLIEPAESELKGITNLVVSPDGLLALVPFEALLRTPVEKGPPEPDAFLVSRFTVSYVPSATVYVDLPRARTVPSIVALGDPLFRSPNPDTPPSRELPRLAQTAAEVEALERLAGTRPIRVLTGAAATREGLLAAPELSTAALVHLATHGEASEYEQRKAGLWLAVGTDGEPGFLSVDDVLHLRLHADLVTLSACQTGLGRVARGEGVLGLSRAFLIAGAGSVMVSLWRVNDRSTATLMQGFYEELLSRGKPAPVALATAKRKMLSSPDTRAPFHWAPFVLWGRPPN